MKRIYPFIFLIGCLCLSVGYASITSVNLVVSGSASATVPNALFISDVQYKESTHASIGESEILYFGDTLFHSNITLEDYDGASISYTVSLYNHTDDNYLFKGVSYDSEYYSNPLVTFDVTGLNVGDSLMSGETNAIVITFRYVSEDHSNCSLDSYLNLEFDKIAS